MISKIYSEELSYVPQRRKLPPRVTEEDGLLPVEQDDRPLYWITESGAVRYSPTWVVTDQAEVTLAEIAKMAEIVMEYMTLSESTPLLKAEYLKASCRVPADFNGVALVEEKTLLGVQSTTWAWGYDRRGLNNGHCYKENYRGVKEDFTFRTGLVTRGRVFNQKQLEGLRQVMQGFLCGEAPTSYQQEFRCRHLLDQVAARLPERTQDRIQNGSQKLGQSM